MNQVLLTSIGLQLVTAIIALLVIWGMFRLLDRGMGHPFADAVEKMYENPMAVALYYGLRFLGACILIGLLLS